MKTYVDMTKTQLKRECAKIFEKVTGIIIREGGVNMKYIWKYYKSKTPKNSTGFYFTDNDDECLGEVLLTETAAREFNELLNKQSDTYIYRIRQCKEE